MSPRPARALVVGNWKMNLGESAARSLVAALASRLPLDEVDAAVAPPFPSLRAALDAAAGSRLAIAAQDVYWEERGAFTGEVAPGLLAEMGVRFVIVGHSERRTLFGERDEDVLRKVGACRRHGLIPIVCVGETERQRDAGLTRGVVTAQIAAAFSDATVHGEGDLVVAYEPVWAIGTGRTPGGSEIAEAHAAIRQALYDRFGGEAEKARILYGGSVSASNAGALLGVQGVAGALVGGASLDVETFRAIVEAAA